MNRCCLACVYVCVCVSECYFIYFFVCVNYVGCKCFTLPKNESNVKKYIENQKEKKIRENYL